MAHKLWSTLATAALIMSATSAAAAQELWPISVEATLGAGVGMTDGEYRSNESGITGDLLVAYRMRPALGGALVAAATAGMQGAGVHTSDCLPASDGGCIPSFPNFPIFAALIGWETRTAHFRALTGPAYVDPGSFGWQARLDLARPLFWRLSFVLAGRAMLVPDHEGDAFQLLSAGAGLRLR